MKQGLGHQLKGMFKEVRPVQALISGAFGYYLAPILDRAGVAQILYAKVPTFKNIADYMWNAKVPGWVDTSGKLNASGNKGLATLVELGLAGKLGKDIVSGHITGRDINTIAPMMLGIQADPPGDYSGASPGGGMGPAGGGGGGGYMSVQYGTSLGSPSPSSGGYW